MIIPYYPWSGDKKTGASGDPRRSCGNTASNSTRAARLRPPPSKKMSENLTRWEVWRMQRLRRNIRRVETGMVFVVWALRNCLQGWVVRNLSRGFLCVCPRHLSQEQHANNAFTSTSSVHFLEFWGGRKTYNERKKLSKLYKHTPTHTHIQWIRSIFSSAGRFPCGGQGKIIFIMTRVARGTQLVPPHSNSQDSGEMTYWNHTAAWYLVPVTQKLICGAGAAAASWHNHVPAD